MADNPTFSFKKRNPKFRKRQRRRQSSEGITQSYKRLLEQRQVTQIDSHLCWVCSSIFFDKF